MREFYIQKYNLHKRLDNLDKMTYHVLHMEQGVNIMTVEELIEKLQKIPNKKNRIKMDSPSSGCLLYRGIRDVRISNVKGYTIIELVRE